MGHNNANIYTDLSKFALIHILYFIHTCSMRHHIPGTSLSNINSCLLRQKKTLCILFPKFKSQLKLKTNRKSRIHRIFKQNFVYLIHLYSYNIQIHANIFFKNLSPFVKISQYWPTHNALLNLNIMHYFLLQIKQIKIWSDDRTFHRKGQH